MKLLVLLFIVFAISGCSQDTHAASTKKFEMHHDITWVNTPTNLPIDPVVSFNLAPNSGVYWVGDKYSDDPSEAATKNYVMSFPYGAQMYINIEHLPYRYDRTTAEEQLNTVRKLSMILHWVDIQRPDIEVGIYAMTVEKLFAPLESSPQRYLDRNKRFASLAEYADVVYLDMYTWWAGRHSDWSDALISSTTQARATGKKVILFMWPHYQSPSSGGGLMPGSEWRAQLDEAYEVSDGILIWDKKTCDWNVCTSTTDENNWWFQTLDFMQSNKIN